jgi:lambda family phage portal protein
VAGSKITRILGPNGQPLPIRATPAPARLAARYDAAQTDHENHRHWAEADHYSARAANSIEVRRILRNRSRYERANNSYLDGITLTIANDTIGTGPRLQLRTPDEGLNKRITQAWEEWACCVGLAEKLRTMRQARTVDGEAFALLVTNPRLETPVQLDLQVIECDQISTPFPYPLDPFAVDGMRFDQFGNPTEFHLLKYHPGDLIAWGFPYDFTRIPAKFVIHWFQAKRPNQFRGVPDVTAALPLFAQLRRYTLAVIAAAETAADFAAVLEQSAVPADAEDQATGDAFETLEIVKRMMTTLPPGARMSQFKAEQPTSTYRDFKREILNEIARCLNIPYNIAAGNSSGYNYSSGRLDHQVYYKSIGVDQFYIETSTLDPLFKAWIAEARLTTDLIPQGQSKFAHQWFWDGHGHTDPTKEATAERTRLNSNTTTLADIYARQGHDWRERLEQRAQEVKLMQQLGLPLTAPPTRRPGGA